MTWLCELNAFEIFRKFFIDNYNHYKNAIPASIYLFKINNKNIRKMYETCSKLTIKSPEQHHWRPSGVSLVNFHNFFSCFYSWLRYHCGKTANVLPLHWRDLEESGRFTKWLHTLWRSCSKHNLVLTVFLQK